MSESLFFIWVVLPIIIGLGVIAFIVIIGLIIKARVSVVNKDSFEKLASKLKDDNDRILADLAAMKETLSCINKMMKEIE